MSVLIVYVDDIIVTGDFTDEMVELKKTLANQFEIKDLGNLKYFLGMEVTRSSTGISVSQRKYVLDLLNECGMLRCKPVDTPMVNIKRFKMAEMGVLVDIRDISFSVSVVSQFMNDSREEHMEAVNWILRYLNLTLGKGLFFNKGSSREVQIYSDADWAGSVTDRRSTFGYCTYVREI
ncbi:uncharacterized protein LOC111390860 [Olea europaea var. sylvestris]|uniref:uncharacterized protein LOC111390860 n=1 Tax=Olea europaea var. sylvestris TaxID=158386 RepID=UPI000C1D6F59|nr:uncharacterized protein LOC111390860 [Olea europaea var. sylvestris]